MDGREDHHGIVVIDAVLCASLLTWIDVCNLLVHIEEVAITLTNLVDAEALDAFREVKEHSETSVVHAKALVATLLSSTAGHVTRNEVTECRITALQIVVAILFRNLIALLRSCLQCLCVLQLLWNPDTTVVTQRLGHQSQLRLLVTMHRNTSWVNLNVRRISHHCALAEALNSCCAVTTHSVRREEVGVAIAASSDDDSVCAEALQLASHKVLGDDAASSAVNNHYILHLIAGEQLHLASLNFLTQRRISTEKQLLTCLTLRIERTAYLSTTERTVCQHAAILTSKGYTLCHALVDDVVRHLCQTIDVGFASTIVTAFHCIIEEAINRVAIVLIVLGCIDTTLSCDRVSATGRVLNAEVIYIEAHLGKGSGSTCSSKTCADHDDVELQLVLRVHQTLVSFIFFPFLRHWACRNLRI